MLDIAAVVLAQMGVANSTVRDVADRAGMLSGSLYHHFASKNQLVANEAGIANRSFRPDVDGEVVAQAILDGILASTRFLSPTGHNSPAALSQQLSDLHLGGLLAH